MQSITRGVGHLTRQAEEAARLALQPARPRPKSADAPEEGLKKPPPPKPFPKPQLTGKITGAGYKNERPGTIRSDYDPCGGARVQPNIKVTKPKVPKPPKPVTPSFNLCVKSLGLEAHHVVILEQMAAQPGKVVSRKSLVEPVREAMGLKTMSESSVSGVFWRLVDAVEAINPALAERLEETPRGFRLKAA